MVLLPDWFLGLPFSRLNSDQVLQTILARPTHNAFAYVCTPNAAFVVRAYRGGDGTAQSIDQAWLSLCDSRILAHLALVLFGIQLHPFTGSDLTTQLFERHIQANDPVIIIGGDQTLAKCLRTRFGLTALQQFVPSYGFIHNSAEVDELAVFVESLSARFIFFAVGSPQSEILAARIAERKRATGIGLCIGSSLRFLTGEVARAPRWMQRSSLEWLHRILVEPRRLGRRFLVDQLPILLVALRYRLRRGSERHRWRPNEE